MRGVVVAVILTASVASAEPTAEVGVGPVVVFPAFLPNSAVTVMPAVGAGGFVAPRLAVLARLSAFEWNDSYAGPNDVGTSSTTSAR